MVYRVVHTETFLAIFKGVWLFVQDVATGDKQVMEKLTELADQLVSTGDYGNYHISSPTVLGIILSSTIVEF